jgi:hypothetical protein
MALWNTHSVIGTKASGPSLTKPNRFWQHDLPTTLHTLQHDLVPQPKCIYGVLERVIEPAFYPAIYLQILALLC